MRRHTTTRHTALALLLLSAFALTAAPARTQDRKPAPDRVVGTPVELPVVKGDCPSPVALTLNATTPNVPLHVQGMTPEQVLAALGQPHAREGATFTFCTGDGTKTVRFNAAGHAV